MQVGILGGTGPAGRGLAARLASVGIGVMIGSRSAERAVETRDALVDRWPGRKLAIEASLNEEAARADTVVVATTWDSAAPTAEALAQRLEGKLVVCMANALERIGADFCSLVPPRGSVAASVQAAAPGARVCAALHHLPARSLGDLDRTLDSDVLMCSDERAALEETARLIGKIPGLRPLDAGRLSSASAIEAFTGVLLTVNTRYRAEATIRLTGVDPDRKPSR